VSNSSRLKPPHVGVTAISKFSFLLPFLPFTLTPVAPSLNNPLPHKDAPTPIRHRVQFIASKTSTRWSYGDSVILLFYCLFLPFTLTCRICDFGPSLKKPSHKKMRQPESATVSNYQRIKTLSVGVTADSSNSPFFCLFLSSPILACVPCPCP